MNPRTVRDRTARADDGAHRLTFHRSPATPGGPRDRHRRPPRPRRLPSAHGSGQGNEPDGARYQRFWAGCQASGSSTSAARASTRYYARQRASACSPSTCAPLSGLRILKTDLMGRGEEHAHPGVGGRRGALARSASTSRSRRCVQAQAARSRASDGSAAGRGGRCPRAALPRRQLRRDLLDGNDRAFRRDRAGRAARWRAS